MQLFVPGCFESFEYTNKIDAIFCFVLFCVTKIYPHAKTEKQEKGKREAKRAIMHYFSAKKEIYLALSVFA